MDPGGLYGGISKEINGELVAADPAPATARSLPTSLSCLAAGLVQLIFGTAVFHPLSNNSKGAVRANVAAPSFHRRSRWHRKREEGCGYRKVGGHELIHWTSHPSRLDRQLGERFDHRAKAADKLIAELGAAFLCAEFAIDAVIPHAANLEHYLKLLTDDPKAIFTAASKAQAAVDYLREQLLNEPISTHAAPFASAGERQQFSEAHHV